MPVPWRSAGDNRKYCVKAGVLILGAWTAFYMAVWQPLPQFRSMAMQRGIAESRAVGWERVSLWQQHSMLSRGWRIKDTVVARPVTASTMAHLQAGLSAPVAWQASANRKIVRTSSLELQVKSPADTGEKIHALGERIGGYLVSSHRSGSRYCPGGAVTMRAPADRFEKVRAEIKKLAAHIERENRS